LPRRDQEVQHALRGRAAIGIVAEMDDAPVRRPARRDIRPDALMHGFEQVEPSMHVADGVEPHPFRTARVEKVDAGRHRVAYPPTMMMCSARGPCAPRSSFCSISPERDVPVMKFSVRGIPPLPNRLRTFPSTVSM